MSTPAGMYDMYIIVPGLQNSKKKLSKISNIRQNTQIQWLAEKLDFLAESKDVSFILTIFIENLWNK